MDKQLDVLTPTCSVLIDQCNEDHGHACPNQAEYTDGNHWYCQAHWIARGNVNISTPEVNTVQAFNLCCAEELLSLKGNVHWEGDLSKMRKRKTIKT
jgi:hypothetical protein